MNFKPGHQLSKSMLRQDAENAMSRSLIIYSLRWGAHFEGGDPATVSAQSALELVRSESELARAAIEKALDPEAGARERIAAAREASFKTAGMTGIWELVEWERAKEGRPMSESDRPDVEGIEAVCRRSLGALGSLIERLRARGEKELAREAFRTDEMLGFSFCQDAINQWMVFEERQQIEGAVDGRPAPARGGPRI